jgi:hypothetical protein
VAIDPSWLLTGDQEGIRLERSYFFLSAVLAKEIDNVENLHHSSRPLLQGARPF